VTSVFEPWRHGGHHPVPLLSKEGNKGRLGCGPEPLLVILVETLFNLWYCLSKFFLSQSYSE
jgi:hypothetical protein